MPETLQNSDQPWEYQLPSGMTITIPSGMDPSKQETKDYFKAYVAKHYPEDAKALGIDVNPADNYFSQVGNELAVGGGQMVSGLEGVLDWVTGNKSQDDWGGQKFSRGFRSNYGLQALKENANGELNISSTLRGVVESAPSMLATAGVGTAAGLAAKGVGAGVGLATKVGIGVGAVAEGAQGAGDAYNTVFQGIMNQKGDPESPIPKSQEFLSKYQAALQRNGDPKIAEEEAWTEVAHSQASLAAPLAGVSDIIPALIGGHYLNKAIGPIASKLAKGPAARLMENGVGREAREALSKAGGGLMGGLKGALAGAGTEGFEEFLQSGGEQASQNFAMNQVDPRVNIGEGVLDAAVRGGLMGAVGGGIMSGGLGAYNARLEKQARDRQLGAIERGKIGDKTLEEKAANYVAAMQAGNADAVSTRAKMEEADAAEAAKAAAPVNPQISGTRYNPSAKPQNVEQVPRLIHDRSVDKPETFDYEPPFNADVGRARGDVRAAMQNGQRATVTVTQGKGKNAKQVQVPAHEYFDSIFQPDQKLTEATEKLRAAESQYEYDRAAYNAKPENERGNYNRHMNDSRRQKAEAVKAYRGAKAAAEVKVRKQANEWNTIARAQGLPEVKFTQKPSIVGRSAQSGGPLQRDQQQNDTKPRNLKPTADDLYQQASNAEDRVTAAIRAENNPAATQEQKAQASAEKARAQADLDIINSQIEAMNQTGANASDISANEDGSVNRNREQKVVSGDELSMLLNPTQPEDIDAEPVEAPETGPRPGESPAMYEARRLINSENLPVQRTDIQTPRTDQQTRENKLSDDVTYEVVPASTERQIANANANAGRDDGTNAVPPQTEYRILKTTKGLHGTNIGTVLKRKFSTKEEAEDFLADRGKDKNIKLPQEAVDRKKARDAAAAENAQEKKEQREAAMNLASMRSFQRVFESLDKKILEVAEAILKQVGLSGKGIVLTTFDSRSPFSDGMTFEDRVKKMIMEYNRMNPRKDSSGKPIPVSSGTEAAVFNEGVSGRYIIHGTKNNPLAIIALDRFLIGPNMNQEQIKTAVERVVRHELVHALVRGGFITPNEYSMLLNLVRKRKMPGEKGEKGGKLTYLEYTQFAYKDMPAAVQEEEAIAELIALEGFGVSKTPMGPQARGVIDRVVRLIKAIFGMLGDKDFRRFVDFMESVKDGSLAKRVVGRMGIDPANIVDPFGRKLNGAADMRISIPLQLPPETEDATRKAMFSYAAKNKGEFPAGLSLSPISGTIFKDVEIKPLPEYAGHLASAIPSFPKLEDPEVSVKEIGGKQRRILDYKKQIYSPVKVSDIFDLGDTKVYGPEINRRILDSEVFSFSGAPMTTMAAIGLNPNESGSTIFAVNGKPFSGVLFNSNSVAIGDARYGKNYFENSTSHELQHLVNIFAASTRRPSVESGGSTIDFSLHRRTPKYSEEDINRGTTESEKPGSTISSILSSNSNWISSYAMLKDSQSNGSWFTDAYAELEAAAENVPEIFWKGIFDAAEKGLPEIHQALNRGSITDTDIAITSALESMRNAHVSNVDTANHEMRKVLDRLIGKDERKANFLSHAANVLMTKKIFDTFRHIENTIEQKTKATSQIEQTTTDALVYAIASDAARLFDVNHQYAQEDGENLARAAEDESGDPRGAYKRIKNAPKHFNPTIDPSKWTVEQVSKAYPPPTSDEEIYGIVKDSGVNLYSRFQSPIPSDQLSGLVKRRAMQQEAKRNPGVFGTSSTDMRTGGMGSLEGLNVDDVSVLIGIMGENPLLNIEDVTKLLNSKKRSDRRSYRPNEVQGIVNRLAAISPELSRDGTNPEAIVRYEKLWGTDRLKGVLADAHAGLSDVALAKRYGIARSSIRAGLDAMNVQRTNPEDNMTPEISARRLPASVIEFADKMSKEGMGIKPLLAGEEAPIPVEYAMSSSGKFAPSRGNSYVLQEMLRESEDGGRGRTIGQIYESLRKAGYKGHPNPVINSFMGNEKHLRKLSDPSYYVGGTAFTDMRTGGGDENGKIIDAKDIFSKRMADVINARNEEEQTKQAKVVVDRIETLRKGIFGVVEPEDMVDVVLTRLRKEEPIRWRRITNRAESKELLKTILATGLMFDAEAAMGNFSRSATGYFRMANDGRTDPGDVQYFVDMGKMLEWIIKTYFQTPGTSFTDMRIGNGLRRTGVNIYENKYVPVSISPEKEKWAKQNLTDLQYDVMDIIRNGPPEGVTSDQIADKLSEQGNYKEPKTSESVTRAIRVLREKGIQIPQPKTEKSPRNKEVLKLKAAGINNNNIAKRLFGEDIDAMIEAGMDPDAALARASNTVASIVSQANKSGNSFSDMRLSTTAEAIKEVLKERKESILKNADRYAQNQTGDAILDQMTALHRVLGKGMGNPENFLFDHVNMGEGLERIVDKYRQAGGSIDAMSNPAIEDELSKGKTRIEVEKNFDELFNPLTKLISELGVTREMVEEISKISDTAARWFAAQKENGRDELSYNAAGLYLLAKHAPYREEFLRRKKKQTKELRGGEGSLGVGIQLEEAAKIQKFFDDKLGVEKTTALSKGVQNIVDRLNKIREDGGLIPAGLETMQFYVPARGFAERDGEEDLNFVTLGPGSRGRTPLRQDPKMKGRISLPDEPMTSLAQMMQVAIMRKNINETLNSIRRLVENNAGLFEGRGKFVAAVHYEKPHGMNLAEEPLWLRGRVIKSADGKESSPGDNSDIFYIELSPEFVNISRYFMPSMHEKGQVDKLLSATTVVRPIMDFLRSVRTSKNPAFLPVNLVRDIGTGAFNVEMYLPGAQGEFLRRMPQVISDVLSHQTNPQLGKKYGKLADEFIENGGNQNLHAIDDYDQIAKNISKKLSENSKSEKSATDKAKSAITMIGDWIEKANNAAELASRVSAYSIAKERFLAQGMSQTEAIKRAVYIGRNLTVNFNKHGNLGKGINNLYMFWNASIGGTAQIFRAAASSPKLRMQLMAIAALGFALPFIMRALMGDDWEKIPDWVKDRNIIIPSGDGNFFTIPMPYGYSWFITAGMNASEAAYKSQNPLYGTGGAAQWLTLRTLDGLMNNFAPTGSSNDLLTLAAPTLLDPVLELSMNKDWTGRPIMPMPGMRDYDRESQRFWSNTSPVYIGVADFLSGATGGHSRIDGMIEISPNALEYITEYVFGGLGKFLNQNVALATGHAENVSDIPIVRSFAGSTTGEINVASDYAQLQNRVKRVEKSIDDAKKSGNYDLIQELQRNYAFEVDLISAFKNAERLIERQQSIRRAIEDKYRESNADMNEGDRARLQEVKDSIKQIKIRALDETAARR